MTTQLLHGDCRDILKTLPDQSVQTIVTSPPYWRMRRYTDDPREIGQEDTPAAYVAALAGVFAQCWRVLRDDGVLFLNLGDSYWGSGQGYGDTKTTNKGHKGSRQRKKPNWNPSGARHVGAYGTSGKALEDYQDRGCLCGNLCDVCRVAYRSRTDHTDGLLVAMLVASLSESNHAHREVQRAHFPTSDSAHQAIHSAPAIQDREHSPDHAAARLLSALASMLGESFPQHRDVCLQRASRGECLLCARSLAGYARAFAGTLTALSDFPTNEHAMSGQRSGIPGSAATGDALDSRIGGMVSGFCSYPHYTTLSHQPLKPKSLIGMPWRVAFALQDAGWILRTEIIWEKPNAMPESVKDRPTRSHEYVFLFSKSPRYYFDAAAISEPIKQSSIDRISQPTFDAQTGGPKDYGATSNRSMRKTLENFKKKQDNHGRRHEGFNDRYDFNNPNPTRNARTVWSIPTTGLADEHYAPMPQALAERCIRAGSKAGDMVLDPFGGSGTTGRAALALQRRAILIDLGYQDMQSRRTDGVQVELFV